MSNIAPLTSKQAVQALKISMTKFRDLVKRGLITKLPGVNRYARAEIERYARGEK